jgi:hypothetical protein
MLAVGALALLSSAGGGLGDHAQPGASSAANRATGRGDSHEIAGVLTVAIHPCPGDQHSLLHAMLTMRDG